MQCLWCKEDKANKTTKNCYWIMPDGASTVEVRHVPALECSDCGIYLEDEINEQVEDKLYTSDLSQHANVLTYEELLQAPTIE